MMISRNARSPELRPRRWSAVDAVLYLSPPNSPPATPSSSTVTAPSKKNIRYLWLFSLPLGEQSIAQFKNWVFDGATDGNPHRQAQQKIQNQIRDGWQSSLKKSVRQ